MIYFIERQIAGLDSLLNDACPGFYYAGDHLGFTATLRVDRHITPGYCVMPAGLKVQNKKTVSCACWGLNRSSRFDCFQPKPFEEARYLSQGCATGQA
jgi:hypothetical protein